MQRKLGRIGARVPRKSVPRAEAADPLAVRNTAINLLARRDFATDELRVKLERRGYDHDVVGAVMAELTEERILDDARYAANYVGYHAARGQGPLRIAAELSGLGLPDPLIEAALASGPDWQAAAREVRLRKFGPEEPADWTEKARQARFLQYRGFSSDDIRSALGADFDLD
jgi:regulatory protein